jgi:hypothetical protein
MWQYQFLFFLCTCACSYYFIRNWFIISFCSINDLIPKKIPIMLTSFYKKKKIMTHNFSKVSTNIFLGSNLLTLGY